MKAAGWHSLSETAKEAAVEWHARLGSRDACDNDYAAFGEWISANPEHAAAMAEVERADEALDKFRDADPSRLDYLLEKPAATLPPAPPVRWRVSNIAAMAATLLFFIAGAAVLTLYSREGVRSAHYESVAALEMVTLDDGTSVTLSPGARMEVALGKRRREVTAFEGIAYFHVAPDKSRPFTIALGDRTVTVVGTQFEVLSRDGARSVAVADGVVSVSDTNSGNGEDAARLFAGDKLSIAAVDDAAVVEKVDPASISVWRNGVLELSNASVAEIVIRLNDLYGPSSFMLVDATVGDLRFSGVLQLSDAASVARRIGELMPVKAIENKGRYQLTAERSAAE